MDFNIDFNLVKSQKLVFTPRLKQAMGILEMNSGDLFNYINKQIELNPILEAAGANGPWYGDVLLTPSDNIDEDNEQFEDIDRVISQRFSVKEYLKYQLKASKLNRKKKIIAEYLIENVNDKGYLNTGVKETATFFNVDSQIIKEVLSYLQTLDPPGICARDVKECLLIQLKQMDNDDLEVQEIINEYLENLAYGSVSAVSESTGIDEKKVWEIYKLIKSLEPKPGREFCVDNGAECIVYDIIAQEKGEKINVKMNENSVPDLKVSEFYRDIIKKDIEDETKKFIRSGITNALWLIKCIDERKRVLKKVGSYIANKQKMFFKQGREYLTAIDLNRASSDLNISRYLLEKIIREKYLWCRWGVLELKDFFSQA